MARAAWYDFIPEPYCFFCGERTKETVTVHHYVGDLSSDKVAINAHRRCYRRRIGGMFLLIGATLIVSPLVLGLIEAMAFYNSYRPWNVLPILLWAVNVFAGIWIGGYVGVLLGRRYYKEITDHVQLRTYPYP
ncbi:MAG: hypothetical protein JXO72_08175 [Vicinamibacteria bacterium]|nr:hypothetical protein [Vicinamibacteria bacterium]